MIKEVKKWEKGITFPTESKIVDALEGILGIEIINSLEGFKTEENNFTTLAGSEDEIFKVNSEKLEISHTKIDRLRNIFQRDTQSNNEFNYDSDFDTYLPDQEVSKIKPLPNQKTK